MYAMPFDWKEYQTKEMIKERMYDKKKDAVQHLSSIIHPDYAESFLEILAWAYWQDDKEAKKIASDFCFTELDMAASADYLDEFEQYLVDRNIHVYDC